MMVTIRRSIAFEQARFTDLDALRRFVSDACGDAHTGDAARDALELAVDEACTNIVEHGYPAHQPGPLEVAFDCDADEVRVHIADRGKPFPPDLAPLPDTTSGWTRRPPGGLGWHFIHNVVDDVRYESAHDGTNRLTLVVRRPFGGNGKQS